MRYLVDDYDIKCLICGKICKNRNGLSQHLKRHEINSTDYTIRYILNQEIPKCKCGCGCEVRVWRFCSNDFVQGHVKETSWQNRYDKNSQEYLEIVEKIRVNTSKSTKGKKKSKIHCENISKGKRKWTKDNPDKVREISNKMTKTKRKQSKSGILSENHYTKTKTKKEIENIYSVISTKSKKTKEEKKRMGIYPEVWNKGETKFTNKNIKKYSGRNHYRYNPNKIREYDEKFYDKNYRNKLLRRQNGICIISGKSNDLVLHHIDEDKLNSFSNNLVFLNRSVHIRLHNNDKFKNKCNSKFDKFFEELNLKEN